MSLRNGSLGAAAAALVLGLVVAGCGPGGGGPKAARRVPHPLPADTMTVPVREIGRYGGRMVLAQTNGPKTFNTLMASETSSNDVDDRLFVGLTEFDNATQQNVPMLAKSWDVSPDGLTWTWHLRRGAAFSDGHPITSDDVLFTFAVTYDSLLHPSTQDLLLIGGKPLQVSAPDSYTVVTRAPAPYALMVPAVGAMRIMPRHVLERAWRAGRFASAYGVDTPPESLVTSGPWKLGEYVPQEKTVLVPNPWWFGVDPKGQRLPYLDQLVWVIVPDQNTAALKFQAGDVDAIDNVKPEDYARYARDQVKGGYTLYDLGPSLSTSFFWFNLNRAKSGPRAGKPMVDAVKYAWFSNRDFRRAVSMAVDRDAIIRSVYFGVGVKNWSLMGAGNKQFYPYAGASFPWDYHPDEARRLLAKLGFRDTNGDSVLEDPQGHPVSFTLKTHGDNQNRVAMANFVKDDLAKVGIRCTPALVDFNALVTNLKDDMRYDAILLGLGSGVPPDPGMAQNVLRSSGDLHYWNMRQSRPATPQEARINALMDVVVSTHDQPRRRAAWAEIENIVNQECWVVWLPSIKVKIPVRNRFGNLEPTVIPHRVLWNSDRIFLKPHARS